MQSQEYVLFRVWIFFFFAIQVEENICIIAVCLVPNVIDHLSWELNWDA